MNTENTMYHTLDILARTIYGEARGESYNGKVAVAWTIINRSLHPSWWGKTIVEVCIHPFQYSCWNKSDPNFQIISEVTLDNSVFRECFAIACMVCNHFPSDPTNGATHYYAASIQAPSWTKAMVGTAVIGAHHFFKDPTLPSVLGKALKA